MEKPVCCVERGQVTSIVSKFKCLLSWGGILLCCSKSSLTIEFWVTPTSVILPQWCHISFHPRSHFSCWCPPDRFSHFIARSGIKCWMALGQSRSLSKLSCGIVKNCPRQSWRDPSCGGLPILLLWKRQRNVSPCQMFHTFIVNLDSPVLRLTTLTVNCLWQGHW